MARANAPVFLAQTRYRQRRLRDALWLLPLIGAVLFALPLLWPQESDVAEPARNASALIYIFAVWAVLIGLAAVLGGKLRIEETGGASDGPQMDRNVDRPEILPESQPEGQPKDRGPH